MSRVAIAGQAARERAAMAAVARGKALKGIRYDCEAADLLNIPKATYARYNARAFQDTPFRTVCEMARTFGLTAKEWCEMAGIRYE